jgi:hypothetical protein
MSLVARDPVTNEELFELDLEKAPKEYTLRLSPEARVGSIRRFINTNCLEMLRPKGRAERLLMQLIEEALLNVSMCSKFLSPDERSADELVDFFNKLPGARLRG